MLATHEKNASSKELRSPYVPIITGKIKKLRTNDTKSFSLARVLLLRSIHHLHAKTSLLVGNSKGAMLASLASICCCCKKSPMSSDDSSVELSSKSTNASVMCKCGLYGNDVHISTDQKNSFITVKGVGIALGSSTLDCDTAYWEVRIGENPEGVKVGIKRFHIKKPSDLSGNLDDIVAAGDDSPAWHFKGPALRTGDVVGVYWDQTDLPMLSFSLNGNIIPEASILRIRPATDISPAVSVKLGSSCEMIFDGNHFLNQPKSNKFQMIISAKSLI